MGNIEPDETEKYEDVLPGEIKGRKIERKQSVVRIILLILRGAFILWYVPWMIILLYGITIQSSTFYDWFMSVDTIFCIPGPIIGFLLFLLSLFHISNNRGVNPEIKDVKVKARPIWGWIITFIGTLVLLAGFASFFISAAFYDLMSDNIFPKILFIDFMEFFVIGIPIILLGILLYSGGEGWNIHRSWGWGLICFGGLLTIVGIKHVIPLISVLIEEWINPTAKDYSLFYTTRICISTPLLLFGIPFLVFGTIYTLRRKKLSQIPSMYT